MKRFRYVAAIIVALALVCFGLARANVLTPSTFAQVLFGQYNAAGVSLGDGATAPLEMDAAGNAKVVAAVGSSGPAAVVACDQSVVINVGAAGTAQLVALSGSKGIYVCSFGATVAGTSPTVQLEYGTGTNCATGTSTLTGTMAPTSGTYLHRGDGLGTVLRAPSGQALCIVAGGTTPSIQGTLTYAQF